MDQKFKSYTDVTRELKAFFSIGGHSAVLVTNSLLKKVFWLCFILALFIFRMYHVDGNLKSYQANYVVTKIIVIHSDDYTMTFPAVTFCLVDFSNPTGIKRAGLREAFFNCYFETSDNICTLDDFEIYSGPYYDMNYDCYKFNEGKMSSTMRRKYYRHQNSEWDQDSALRSI